MTVLDGELDSDTETFLQQKSVLVSFEGVFNPYPVTGSLGDIFTDLLWRQTKRTDLWRKGR